MRFSAETVAFVAIFIGGVAYPHQDIQAPSQKLIEQLQELANPGPEHRELANYAGDWTVEIRLGTGPSAAVYTGTSANRMVVAGRFLHCELDASLKSEVMAGILTLGFDRRNDEFTIHSIDSWGTYFVTARGKRVEDSKLIKLYGTDNDPYMKSMGLTKEFAFAVDLTGPNKFSIKVYMIDNRNSDRRELLMMEYKFSKAQ